jgi:hypothetical protein
VDRTSEGVNRLELADLGKKRQQRRERLTRRENRNGVAGPATVVSAFQRRQLAGTASHRYQDSLISPTTLRPWSYVTNECRKESFILSCNSHRPFALAHIVRVITFSYCAETMSCE